MMQSDPGEDALGRKEGLTKTRKALALLVFVVVLSSFHFVYEQKSEGQYLLRIEYQPPKLEEIFKLVGIKRS